MRIGVNLSALSLRDERMAEYLAVTVGKLGIPASTLEIEITESTLADDTDAVLQNLAAFASMGVRSSIDDFGTGFSSLAYLKHLPVNAIKIDKSFVMNMPQDTRDQAIVAAAIHMAHSLGMEAVAEGVENDLVLRMLKRADCDTGQGYHWTKPVAAPDFRAWLAARTTVGKPPTQRRASSTRTGPPGSAVRAQRNS